MKPKIPHSSKYTGTHKHNHYPEHDNRHNAEDFNNSTESKSDYEIFEMIGGILILIVLTSLLYSLGFFTLIYYLLYGIIFLFCVLFSVIYYVLCIITRIIGFIFSLF